MKVTTSIVNDKIFVVYYIGMRKLGTLKELTETLATDRDGVMAWAKEQASIETDKYGLNRCIPHK